MALKPSSIRSRLSRNRTRCGHRCFEITVTDFHSLKGLLVAQEWLDARDMTNFRAVQRALEAYVNYQVGVMRDKEVRTRPEEAEDQDFYL
jgi:hypothetical protein